MHNEETVRETRRLDYLSATDWTDTVIESDPKSGIGYQAGIIEGHADAVRVVAW